MGRFSDQRCCCGFVPHARGLPVCLGGIKLFSDRQPARLRVDDGAAGPPHIWLRDADEDTAWIVVNAGDRAWIQLAYQFGRSDTN
jgi:hypothetical protein